MEASNLNPISKTQVIPTGNNVLHWIEPWYVAYAILGALASGAAVILIPLMVVERGGTAIQIGMAIAAQNCGAFSAPLWGWISDKSKAYRLVFFGGFLLIAAGFIGFALINSRIVWIVGSFFIGFGTAASNTVASLFVVEFTPAKEWSQRISWLQTFNAIGSVLGMAGAGLLHPELGMLLAAALVVPALLVGGVGLPVVGGRFHTPDISREKLALLARRIEPLTGSVVSHLHALHLSDFNKSFRAACSSSFGIFLTGWFFFSFGVSSFSSLYPVLMSKSFGMSVKWSCLVMSIATAGSIALYNVAGRLTTRSGPASILSIGIAVRTITLVGLGALGLAHLRSPLLPAILLFGLFQGIWPLLSVASNDLSAALAPCGEGVAMGLFSAAAAIASAGGAITGGAIADRLGYPSVSLFAAVGTAISFACMFHLSASNRRVLRVAPSLP
jgi:DHA1 family tetracycline resistance protein-like MFS transporter